MRIGREPRCYNASDFLQRFPSSSLKSRIAARKRANPGHSLQRLPNLPPEIMNRCTKQPFFRAHPQHIPQHAFHHALTTRWIPFASTLVRQWRQKRVRQWRQKRVRQWRQKRVLMRPEAAFPYVFAAEGAQHPPKSRHAQRPTATRPTKTTQSPATTQSTKTTQSPATKQSASGKRRSVKDGRNCQDYLS